MERSTYKFIAAAVINLSIRQSQRERKKSSGREELISSCRQELESPLMPLSESDFTIWWHVVGESGEINFSVLTKPQSDKIRISNSHQHIAIHDFRYGQKQLASLNIYHPPPVHSPKDLLIALRKSINKLNSISFSWKHSLIPKRNKYLWQSRWERRKTLCNLIVYYLFAPLHSDSLTKGIHQHNSIGSLSV